MTSKEFISETNRIWNEAKEKIEEIADKYLKELLLKKGFSESFVEYFETVIGNYFNWYDSIDSNVFEVTFDDADVCLTLYEVQTYDKIDILNQIEENLYCEISKEAESALQLERG